MEVAFEPGTEPAGLTFGVTAGLVELVSGAA